MTTTITRFALNLTKTALALRPPVQITRFSTESPPKIGLNLTFQRHPKTLFYHRHSTITNADTVPPPKKRPLRKKKVAAPEKPPGVHEVVAYATAEEYDLEHLVRGLQEQGLYEPRFVENSPDVVHALARYQGVADREPRDIFFFRQGGLVAWNFNELESGNLLAFLRGFEYDSYSDSVVVKESEVMSYKHDEDSPKSRLTQHNQGNVYITLQNDSFLDKYAFSNGMMLSVKLGIWESALETFIDKIEPVTDDLKDGNKITMSREEVLQRHGELFSLRHVINLSSDLLDTPDFYWENEQLENLYGEVCNYFSISKRTKVMNEKINHCIELIELVSGHLSDKHHIRLEWMIIILIMVEVGFEFLHYAQKFL